MTKTLICVRWLSLLSVVLMVSSSLSLVSCDDYGKRHGCIGCEVRELWCIWSELVNEQSCVC